MTEIIVVRHGQANSHATDETSYDCLSDLGRQQARWLGAHLGTTNPHFDRVITGTLLRQADTAREMGYDIDTQDNRLDELNYFALARALEDQHAIPAPRSPDQYVTHLPTLIGHWERDQLADVPERFSEFSSRVEALLTELCAGHGRALIVTSGGVIGMIVRHVLALDNAGLAKVMLQIMNSSVHRLSFTHDQLMLGAFNATPHLDLAGRAHARTYV